MDNKHSIYSTVYIIALQMVFSRHSGYIAIRRGKPHKCRRANTIKSRRRHTAPFNNIIPRLHTLAVRRASAATKWQI